MIPENYLHHLHNNLKYNTFKARGGSFDSISSVTDTGSLETDDDLSYDEYLMNSDHDEFMSESSPLISI